MSRPANRYGISLCWLTFDLMAYRCHFIELGRDGPCAIGCCSVLKVVYSSPVVTDMFSRRQTPYSRTYLMVYLRMPFNYSLHQKQHRHPCCGGTDSLPIWNAISRYTTSSRSSSSLSILLLSLLHHQLPEKFLPSAAGPPFESVQSRTLMARGGILRMSLLIIITQVHVLNYKYILTRWYCGSKLLPLPAMMVLLLIISTKQKQETSEETKLISNKSLRSFIRGTPNGQKFNHLIDRFYPSFIGVA